MALEIIDGRLQGLLLSEISIIELYTLVTSGSRICLGVHDEDATTAYN